MSDRIIPALGFSCAFLTASYMALMLTTVGFAAYQTQAQNDLRNSQSAIGNLEASYYTKINQINSMDPTTLGFVEPAQVEYVAQASDASAGFAFNGN